MEITGLFSRAHKVGERPRLKARYPFNYGSILLIISTLFSVVKFFASGIRKASFQTPF